MVRVNVSPGMLRWARERAGRSLMDLQKSFPKLATWESNEGQPTLRQLENFANAVHVPIGYLFLPEPPVEDLPLSDFRAPTNLRRDRPSPDLLETIYICQQRQDWYREFMRTEDESELAFVGSVTVADDVVTCAAIIRDALGFDTAHRATLKGSDDALRLFINQAEQAGVLVMCNGIVLNNTHRILDPEEFRGFALADNLAPLVFINGADFKAAQMFTLAHELAHIWLGQTAVSDAHVAHMPDNNIEQWCNRVAAELLVPLDKLVGVYRAGADLDVEVPRLTRHFKVSSLVILRRLLDAGHLSSETYWQAYNKELQQLRSLPKSRGGNFYSSQPVRLSRRFARALISSTLAGETLYRDAFHLLAISKTRSFHELGATLGVMA